jgi:hypothetical protein
MSSSQPPLVDMENIITQPTYTTIYTVPNTGDVDDASTWETAITTVPVESTFQFTLNGNYKNHYIYWSLTMRNESAASNSFAGVGIRWYDIDDNAIRNDSMIFFLPTSDTIFQEISIIAPVIAVRGELIWTSGTNVQWSGSTTRVSTFHRWIINWN